MKINCSVFSGAGRYLSVVACVVAVATGANAGWELSLSGDGTGTMTDGTLVLKVSEADASKKTFVIDGCVQPPENLVALDLSGAITSGVNEWHAVKISNGAFTNALAKLTSVKLRGEKLHTIGSNAFGSSGDKVKYPSENLVSLDVELPALTDLGNGAFGNLRWLESLRVHAPSLSTLKSQALSFMGCNALASEKTASRWPVADIYLPKLSKIYYAGMRYLDFDGTLRLPSLEFVAGSENFLDAGFSTIDLPKGTSFGSTSLSRMSRTKDVLRRNVLFGTEPVTFTKALASSRTTYWFRSPPPKFVGTGFRNDNECPKSEYLRFAVDSSATGWESVAEAARLRPLDQEELAAYRGIYGDGSEPVGWVSYEDFGGTLASGPFAVLVFGDADHVLPDFHVCSVPEGIGGVEPECGTYEAMKLSERTRTVSAEAVSVSEGYYVPTKYVMEEAAFNGWGVPVTNAYAAGSDVEIVWNADRMKRLTWLFECRMPGVVVEESPSGTVTVSPEPTEGSKYYELGASVTVSAVAADGYIFERWEGSVPEEVRTNPVLSLTLNEGISLKPVFAKGWKYDSTTRTVTDGVWTLETTEKDAVEKTLTITGVRKAPAEAAELDISKGVHDGSCAWFFGAVGDNAFSDCVGNIANLSIGGEKLVSIGVLAFSNEAENLSVASLLANVPALEKICDKAFYGMRGLQKFEMHAPKLTTIGESAFFNLGVKTVKEGVLDAPKLEELGAKLFGESWVKFYHRFPKLSRLNNKSFNGSYAVQYLEIGTESGIDFWDGVVLGAVDQMRHAIIGARNDGEPLDLSATDSLKVISTRTLTCWFMGCPPKLGTKSIKNVDNNYGNFCFAPCVGAPSWTSLAKVASERPLNEEEKAYYAEKFPDSPPPAGWLTYRDFGLEKDGKIGFLAKPGNPYMTTTDLIVKVNPTRLAAELPCNPSAGHIRSLTLPRSVVASAPCGKFVAANGSKWVFEGYEIEVADHDSSTGWRKISGGVESDVAVEYSKNGAKRLTWNYRCIPGLIIKIR